MSALLRSAGKTARWILSGAAVLLVLWSVVRVGTRELGGGRSGARDGGVELTVMHWSGEGGQEEDAIVADALAKFEAENPGIHVRRINAGDAASFFTKLQTMLAAGDPPDVFYVGYWRLAMFARMGLIRPIDDLLERDSRAGDPAAVDLADFYPVTVDAFRYDGDVMGRGPLYGLPKDFTTIGFYYNKDLFRRAGVPEPADDWTWEEYADAARQIGALEGCTGSEFVTWPMMLRAYLRTEGVDVASEDFATLHLRDPAVVRALERLAGWRHGEDDTLTSGKSKVAEGASVFLSGKVGLAGPFGRWVVPSYRKIEGFEWDFAPLPRGAADANAVTTVAWSIASRTRHPDEAWRLVRALCDEESQASLARLGLAIPTRRKVAESKAFLDPSLPPSRDRAFLDAIPRATVIPWPPNPKFESLLESRLNQAVKTGDLSVDEAIGAFERAWATEGTSPLARGSFPPMPWSRIALAIGAAFLAACTWTLLRARRSRPGRLARAEERAGYMLVSPLLIGLAVFMAFPIGLSLLLSFTRWNGVSTLDQAQLVGLANYKQLLAHDGRFFTSLRVTTWYALLAVPLGQAFALTAALLMNSKLRGIGFFRGAWYLPSVLAGVGVAVLWRWVFDGDAGLLNAILEPLLAPFGLAPPEWFGADAAVWGAPAFALMNLWMVGGAMMIYLAGLQGIPRDLYEAADLDGASPWERFTRVTLPMLSPVILFNGIMAIIASFQVFTQAFVMTGGEPGDLTRFYVLYLYNQAFEFYEMGYASAMAWLLLVVVLTLTAIVLRGSRRHVYYEVSQ